MDNTFLLRPNVERLKESIETMATFVDETKPGWTRRSFTPWYSKAREWLKEQMIACGMEVEIDVASNVIGRIPGSNPMFAPIMIGSHTDTVEGGGRFDGIIGVLAGLEIARRIKETRTVLRHTLEIVDFTSEELSEFGINMIGSRGMVNNLSQEELDSKDNYGRLLKDVIKKEGGKPDLITLKSRKRKDVSLYLELHIEQGPILEQSNNKLAAVTGIVGAHRYYVTVEGRQNHVGGSPMNMRSDALAGASQMIVEFESLCRGNYGGFSLIGSVGKLDIQPNVVTIIPGKVIFSIDIRSLDTNLLENIIARFKERATEIAGERGLAVNFESLTKVDAVPVDTEIIDLVEQSCSSTGKTIRMQCGSSHDACQIAKIAPIGMILVSSRDGRSHCPEEWTDYNDVALGVEALAKSILQFDKKIDSNTNFDF